MPTSPDEEFIVIENQVAMTEKPVAKLLGVTIERLHELSRTVGVTNKKGGIYELSGQYVYTSFEIIFKVRDANGRNSADLSTFKLSGLFAQAEKRLLPKQYRQKENATIKKIVAGLLAICFVAFFISAANKVLPDKPKETSQSSTAVKQAAPPKVETVAEKPKPPPKPAKVLNLGMTFEQFKAAYNGKIAEIAPETGWNISATQLKAGDVQDVFTVAFSENVVMLGIVDKATRAVKEILITATPKSETDAEMALLSYGLVLATLNPELNAERRWEVFDALKLVNGKINDLWNGDGKILLGNVRYQTKFDKSLAMFYLTASAKDL